MIYTVETPNRKWCINKQTKKRRQENFDTLIAEVSLQDETVIHLPASTHFPPPSTARERSLWLSTPRNEMCLHNSYNFLMQSDFHFL